MVAERHYDVVLMDVKRPGMDGVSALEEIRKTAPMAKVIFIGGYAMGDSVREALQAGAYAAVTKPVDPKEMLALMRSIAEHEEGDE